MRARRARGRGVEGGSGRPAEEALLARFVHVVTLRLVSLLAEESSVEAVAGLRAVAEVAGAYRPSRRAPAARGEESLELLKRQVRVVAEIEALVRELAESVRRGGAAGRLLRARERLEAVLPEEQAALAMGRLEGLVPELKVLLRSEADSREVLTFAFGERVLSWVCGRGKQARHLLTQVERLAPTELPVLICGETGTGKELVARFVHARSRRAGKPFVALNCAAIPTELLESQLFGQRAGAFTSAREQTGLLEAADGGTFFMDEVAELSPEHQAKLLRFLEEREYRPVGARTPRKADVRLLCATNQELARRVEAGLFRLDLYHRVNDFILRLRPLRERRRDLPLLINFFLARSAEELGRPCALSAEARRRLAAYRWPGNIRELEKAIRRACVLCEEGVIRPEDLYLEEAGGEGEEPAGLAAVRERLEGTRLARRTEVVPAILGFLREAGPRWFTSREWARAAGLSDSQARAQLKALSAEGGPLEHNGEAKAASRYRLRQAG